MRISIDIHDYDDKNLSEGEKEDLIDKLRDDLNDYDSVDIDVGNISARFRPKYNITRG